MTISIKFNSVPNDKNLRAVVLKAVKTALPEPVPELSIIICSDDFIHELNKQYRGVDRPTDVLSFPSEETDPESGTRYLGDIIVSLPRATAQAAEAGHPISNEISMLVIHGVLHLLGYDHQNEAEKKQMWAQQDTYLKKLGIIMDKFSGDE